MLAEGVETAEQLSFLRDNDCDEIQGYFFSKPVPAEEIARMFAAGNEQRLNLARENARGQSALI